MNNIVEGRILYQKNNWIIEKDNNKYYIHNLKEFYTDNPVIIDNNVKFDNPYIVPEYIKKTFKKLVKCY